MNPLSTISVTIFAFIWIASIESTRTESLSENDKSKFNLPSFFIRSYNMWSRNNTCNYERMKSLALDLKHLRENRIRMTTRMATGNLPLKKAELRVELHGYPNPMAMQNRTFLADIQSLDLSLDIRPIRSTSYIGEDFVEFTFDVTKLYNATRIERLRALQFKVKFLRRNRRLAKVFNRGTMKAFIIIYERLKSCGFGDAFQQDARAKRSRDIYLEKDNVPEGITTMGLNITEEYCHKKESSVTFAEKGMDFVIYPSSYMTSDCLLNLALPPSSVETDMTKVRKIDHFACCMPTDFDSLTMIFEDVKNDGWPVMSKFNDMAAKRCGCRLN